MRNVTVLGRNIPIWSILLLLIASAAATATTSTMNAPKGEVQISVSQTLTIHRISFPVGYQTDYYTSYYDLSADAWVKEDKPDENHGSDISLEVGNAGTRKIRRIYLKSTCLKLLPSGVTIEGARLYFYRESGNPVTLEIGAYSVSSSWTETGITWNNAPTDFQLISTTIVDSSVGWKIWDITSAAISAYRSTDKTLSLALKLTNETILGKMKLTSREGSADCRPYIEVSYSLTTLIYPTMDVYDYNIIGEGQHFKLIMSGQGGDQLYVNITVKNNAGTKNLIKVWAENVSSQLKVKFAHQLGGPLYDSFLGSIPANGYINIYMYVLIYPDTPQSEFEFNVKMKVINS